MATAAAPQSTSAHHVEALIIGAGFAGLYQLHLLRDRLGLDARVLEAGSGVGGTWYWNRYPGARCDSESHGYCYTFDKSLRAKWQFSERYPGHAEIRRYLDHVAETLDLKRDIRLETRVTSAAFDDEANRWTVRTDKGDIYTCTFLIAAVGCLSTANIPKIKGLESFRGRWYHTGNWPHEGVDFTGKRVGQIGTGSTGIQCAPVVAETAKHLTVFQRTPNYSVPARNAPLSAEAKAQLAKRDAEIIAMMRSNVNGHPFMITDRAVFDVPEAERRAIYEAAWETGGLQFRAAFRDLLMNKEANDTAAEFLKSKIREVVKDPETARKLSNIDHPYAAKRPPIDTNYFETFNRPNVSLVDVREDPIEEITPEGIRTRSGSMHALDIIIFATGFDAMTGPLLSLGITGKDGQSLKDVWKAGPVNYLGLQVAGFPNLFTVTGPGSPSVLTNMPIAIEQHVEWIANCIAHMRTSKLDRIEATSDAMERWMGQVNEAANATLLPTVKHSWYLGANVPGKPRVFMPYAGGLNRYRKICDEVAAKGYEGFEFSRAG